MGSTVANFTRLTVAMLLLALFTFWLQPDSLHRTTFLWLFLSGFVGFGIGDMGLYLAYARVGSRITILVTFCIAPVLAALVEWLWLGTTLTWAEMAGIAAIVLGVSQSLKPSSPDSERYGSFAFGIGMALVSAAGQGMGAVLTRQANQKALELAVEVPALSQAFQRIIAGVIVSGILLLFLKLHQRMSLKWTGPWKPRYATWIMGTAIFGPVVGVVLYQHALATTESAIVLAIVAATPIILMPFAYVFEKDRPNARTIIGAVVAVLGMAWLGVYRVVIK